jgi:hypothetical protein
MRATFAGVAAVLLGLVMLAGEAEAAAPKVFTQGGCRSSTGNDKCSSFYAYQTMIPLIRTFKFTAPGPGVALVTFNGTMSCTNSSAVDAYIDLAAQIVTSQTAAAASNGPGGAHHLVVVPTPSTLTPTVEINLASSRALTYPSGGQKTVYFRITKLHMGETTACDVFNPMFTVLYFS